MTPTTFAAGKGPLFILRRIIVPAGSLVLLVILKNLLSLSGPAPMYFDAALFFFSVSLFCYCISTWISGWSI